MELKSTILKSLLLMGTPFVLTACGVELQLETTQVSVEITEGDQIPISIRGTWEGTDIGNNDVFVRVINSNTELVFPTTINVTGSNSFELDVETQGSLDVGSYQDALSILACADVECSYEYPDSALSLELSIQVFEAPEWTTHQANASHNAYIPIWVDAENIEKIWEWDIGENDDPISGINMPVAGDGLVFLSTDVYNSSAYIIALDESTGVESWRQGFGDVPALNPPALGEDNIFIATSGHDATKVWALDRRNGDLQFQSPFRSQWGNYLAPVVYDGQVFQTGGYYGGYTYAFSASTGDAIWEVESTSSSGMDSSAVDESFVYSYSNTELTKINRSSGIIEARITDPFGNTDREHHGSPVIGSMDNVVVHSGGGFSGRASSNVEQYEDRIISSFDIIENSYQWSSSYAYKTHFAVANGVVYAGRGSSATLDAIDEKTGDILWSWVAPDGNSEFHRNIVVTKNLVFASTDKNIYAIDLNSHEVVWSYNEPGMIVISDSRNLFIATGMRQSDGRLSAFKTTE